MRAGRTLAAHRDRNIRYTYDATEQTGKTEREGTVIDSGAFVKDTTYVYNLQGRLASIEIDTDDDGIADQTLSYQYNDAGIRVSATENGVTTIYHVDPNNRTGYAQVLEEGIDDDADGRLDAAEVDKTLTLGHDVIAQQAPSIEGGATLCLLVDWARLDPRASHRRRQRSAVLLLRRVRQRDRLRP